MPNALLYRSRCKHLEDFEKPTKYFLGLQTANHKVKHIQNLNYEGKSYTVPAEILQIQHDYFSKIYTEEYNGSIDTDNENYLNGIDIPQISEQSKFLCEGDITLQDVKEAINRLANNKTPGPDGIPSEFYKTFWTEIGNELFKSFVKFCLKDVNS